MGAGNDVAAGAAASDTQQANGLSKAKKALTKLRAPSEATLKLLAKAVSLLLQRAWMGCAAPVAPVAPSLALAGCC